MKVVDLFSGIGGFSLGLERAGHQTVAFCEIDPYCRKVLRKHWPNVPIITDINRWVSMSGFVNCWAKEGFTWEQKRALEGSPVWIIFENVHQAWKQWVPQLRGELYKIGYSSLPIHVRASDFGLPHRRSRIFLIANPDSDKLRLLHWWCQWEGRKEAAKFADSWDSTPRRLGEVNGIPCRVDRLKCLGNAIVPQIAELIGRTLHG